MIKINPHNNNHVNKTNILVIGDIMVDRYWFGFPKALSKDAPVAVLSINTSEDRPGGAANVALNIKKFGSKVALLAPIGNDKDGDNLKNILTTEGIEQHWIYNDNKTITKHRILSNKQQLVRIDFEKKYNPIPLDDEIKKIINSYKVIVCSDYNKGTLDNCAEIICYAKTKGKIVIVDPKGLNFGKYQEAFMLTPNYKEFTDVVGAINNQHDFDTKAYNLINKLELQYLLVTCGKDGMILFGRDKFKYSTNSYANQVYDVTGAGDTVLAQMAISFANDESKEQAVELASHAAAIVISKVGTGFVTDTEINNQIAQFTSENEAELEDKIVKFELQEDYNNFVDNIANLENSYIYNWTSFKNLFEIEHVKKINALKELYSNIFVILDLEQQNSQETLKINNVHSQSELAYMISKISAVNKVLYREYA